MEGVESHEAEPKKVKSFKTAKGSVYTYDNDGKTTRFKTATGERLPRQDITVFVDLNQDEEDTVLSGYLHGGDKNAKVYILELGQPGEQPTVLRDIRDVRNQSKVALAVIEDGTYKLLKKASSQPVVGWNTFDHRHYQENGEWFSDRHLGNKVTEIEYESS
jgi:hypothetical protein